MPVRPSHRCRRGFARACVALSALALIAAAPAPAIAALPSPTPIPPPGPLSDVGGAALAQTGRVVTDPSVPPPPSVSSAAYVVADADTGQVLAADNPHWKLRPASTLKQLAALVMLPELDPNAVYTGGQLDPSLVATSLVGISPGIRYTVHDLWNGVFLVSGNDAVTSLAQMDGGAPKVVAEMQAKAQQLGALDTTVINPDGLDADGQFSSAYDLTLFARAGLNMPAFRAYCATTTAQFPGKNGTTYQIQNQNHLLTQYPGGIGVKTGYTSLAHNTFVGAATRNGHTVIVTLMDAPYGIQQDSEKLLDWGFSVDGHAQPVGALVASAPTATGTPAAGAQPGPASGGGLGGARGADRVVQPVAQQSSGGGLPLAAYGLIGGAVVVGAGLVLVVRGRRGSRRHRAS